MKRRKSTLTEKWPMLQCLRSLQVVRIGSVFVSVYFTDEKSSVWMVNASPPSGHEKELG